MITLTTDGSCPTNPGKGGWACVVRFGLSEHAELWGAADNTTNNRMEIEAVLNGLRWIERVLPGSQLEVVIRSDSQYVINCATGSYSRRVNKDLFDQLDEVLGRFEGRYSHVSWEWVKGHASDPDNIRCDKLAAEAARRRLQPSTVSVVGDSGVRIVSGVCWQ